MLSSYLILKCAFPTCLFVMLTYWRHQVWPCSKLYLWAIMVHIGLYQALPNMVKKFCIFNNVGFRNNSVPFCKIQLQNVKHALAPKSSTLWSNIWMEWLPSRWIIKDLEIVWYSLILYAQACLKLIFRVTCWLVICLILASQNSIQMGLTLL